MLLTNLIFDDDLLESICQAASIMLILQLAMRFTIKIAHEIVLLIFVECKIVKTYSAHYNSIFYNYFGELSPPFHLN